MKLSMASKKEFKRIFELATNLTENRDFSNAILQYDSLLRTYEDGPKPHDLTNRKYLRLRAYKALCLCNLSVQQDITHLMKTGQDANPDREGYTEVDVRENLYKVAEDYVRETLNLWEQREKLEKSVEKGTADTCAELAACLIRRLGHERDQNRRTDLRKCWEISKLIRRSLIFWDADVQESEESKKRKFRDLMNLLANSIEISDGVEEMWVATPEELRSIEQHYRATIECWEAPSIIGLPIRVPSFRGKLGECLYCQRRSHEALAEFRIILNPYNDLPPLRRTEYLEYVRDCRWHLGLNAALVVTRISKALRTTRDLRNKRIKRKWRDIRSAALAVFRITIFLKSLRIRGLWANALRYAAIAAKMVMLLRKVRAKRRWRTAISISRAIPKLSIALHRCRMRRKWTKAILYSLLRVRYSNLIKKRAHSRWRHAILKVRFIMVYQNSVVVRQNAQAKWSVVMCTLHMYRKIAATCQKKRLERHERKRKAQTGWSNVYYVLQVRRIMRTTSERNRIERAERRLKADRTWSDAILAVRMCIRMTSRFELARAELERRRRRASDNWSHLLTRVHFVVVLLRKGREAALTRVAEEEQFYDALHGLPNEVVQHSPNQTVPDFGDDNDDDDDDETSDIRRIEPEVLFGVETKIKPQK